jgi:hypothetical protein
MMADGPSEPIQEVGRREASTECPCRGTTWPGGRGKRQIHCASSPYTGKRYWRHGETGGIPNITMGEVPPSHGFGVVDRHDVADDLVFKQQLPEEQVVRAIPQDVANGKDTADVG